jgi:hypothetical protein
MMFIVQTSLTIIIYDCNISIVQATILMSADNVWSSTLVWSFQGPYLEHFIFFTTYERVQCTARIFQASLMFVGRSRAYSRVGTREERHSGRLQPCSQTLG